MLLAELPSASQGKSVGGARGVGGGGGLRCWGIWHQDESSKCLRGSLLPIIHSGYGQHAHWNTKCTWDAWAPGYHPTPACPPVYLHSGPVLLTAEHPLDWCVNGMQPLSPPAPRLVLQPSSQEPSLWGPILSDGLLAAPSSGVSQPDGRAFTALRIYRVKISLFSLDDLGRRTLILSAHPSFLSFPGRLGQVSWWTLRLPQPK